MRLSSTVKGTGEVTQPEPDKPPVEQLAGALDAYLGWVERHMGAYDKLIARLGGVDMPLRLLSPYEGFTEEQVDVCRRRQRNPSIWIAYGTFWLQRCLIK